MTRYDKPFTNDELNEIMLCISQYMCDYLRKRIIEKYDPPNNELFLLIYCAQIEDFKVTLLEDFGIVIC